MRAGVFLWLVVSILPALAIWSEARGDSLRVATASRNSDVHLKAGVYSGYTGSTDYAAKMGTESSQHYNYYLWFDNVTLPTNAVVDSAFIWVRGYATDGSNCSLQAFCEDTADAATYPNTTSDIASRIKTTTSVIFAPASWNTGGDDKLGGDVKTIIQEVNDRSDWASGNALGFFFENVHSLGTTNLIFSRTYDYFADGGGTPAPRLVIYYHEEAAVEEGNRRRVEQQFGWVEEYNPLTPFAKGESCFPSFVRGAFIGAVFGRWEVKW